MVTYTNSLRLIQPDTGSYTNTWGNILNTSVFALADQGVAGYTSVALSDANYTLTSANGASDQARNAVLAFTGSLTAARNIFAPAVSKVYVIKNSTTGGFGITIKTTAGGSTGITIPNGNTISVWSDGTNFYESTNSFSSLTLTNLAYTGTLTGGTGVIAIGTNQIYKDAGGNVGFGTATPAAATNYKFVTVQGGTSGGGYTIYNSSGTEVGRVMFDTTAWQFNNFSASLPTTFLTNNVERMRIDSTGNVGVGTTSPFAYGAGYVTLQANGTGGGVFRTTAGGTTVVGDFYADSTNVLIVRASTNTPMAFSTNNVERMRIDAAGNVGIGNTPSGTYKLEVTGSISASTGFVGAHNGTVGATTPAAVTGTTITANTTFNGPIGATAPAAVTGTTITANTTFNGPIGGTPNTGAFTTLSSSGVTTHNADAVFGTFYTPTTPYSVGYRGVPQVGGASKTASYTLALADAGHHVYLTGSTASQSVTIPANASIAFPIGTTISIVNGASVTWTVPITTDTLTLAGGTTTGTRTLAVGAVATCIKVTATAWYISGAGVS